MHTLTLKINNDETWQQLLSFIKRLPDGEVSVQNMDVDQSLQNNWDAMRKALPLLKNLDLTREQPAPQTRDLF
ncbi:hypothetical protein [Thiomicrospira sp. ALE5]|uniref:hypothetical protein n=1 Tax=Thiomicrospira sp. ALE5 TaxID=748650 RepID=UPI0008E07975|nr:hypothetical protein [Thiomicrospira sp. ALE5]SFR52097.1 hypothetical protein SAMN03092900_0623 [Thiomicrospira sp. ALE5]